MGPRCLGAEVSRGRDGLGPKCPVTTYSSIFLYMFLSFSGHILSFLLRAVISYWRKYVYELLVNRLGRLSLPRKSVVRLTDRPDMTTDVYRGR